MVMTMWKNARKSRRVRNKKAGYRSEKKGLHSVHSIFERDFFWNGISDLTDSNGPHPSPAQSPGRCMSRRITHVQHIRFRPSIHTRELFFQFFCIGPWRTGGLADLLLSVNW